MKDDHSPSEFADAFDQLRPRLLEIPGSELRNPNVRVRECTSAVIGVAEQANGPLWRPQFEQLAKSGLWTTEPLDDLAPSARCLWFVRFNLDKITSTGISSKFSPHVLEQATQLRVRMRMVCEYHFHDAPELADRLAYLRQGNGFQDLGADLHAYGDLYETYAGELKDAGKYYDPNDAKLAHELAKQIHAAVGSRDVPERERWRDLQKRAFSFMVKCYNEVRGAGLFIGRQTDNIDAVFPSLWQLSRPARRSPKAQQAANPAEPLQPAQPPVEPPGA